MITHNPLHRSVRAVFPHTAPTLGDDAHSLQRIGVANGGGRKPAVNEPIHSFPGDPLAAPAHTERVAPVAAYLESKSLDCVCIGWRPVIADKSAHHGAAPCPLPGKGSCMSLLSSALTSCNFLLIRFLAVRRTTVYIPLLFFFPQICVNPQEVECLRPFLTAPKAVRSRVRPELDRPRLFRMQRQTELLESLLSSARHRSAAALLWNPITKSSAHLTTITAPPTFASFSNN
jgi:hypothetical protein